ncbi:MAG: hypothetical protein M3Y56_07515, partial [Armatimonadota bacterium]|nr:hypothetical protein [Armatimonadota bacterium]
TGAGVLLALTGLLTCLFLSSKIPSGTQVNGGPTGSKSWHVFSLLHSNITGAELWVNGVNLGQMPVVISEEEFNKRTPIWTEPRTESARYNDMVPVYGYWSDPDPTGRGGFYYHTSTTLEIPHGPKLYVRVRLGNEWGAEGPGLLEDDTDGGYSSESSYSSGGNNIECHAFHLSFPKRDERLRRLLNKARLMGYRVDGAWCKAVESYGEDGWLVLQKAALHDPLLLKALDGWAEWKYGLSGVKTSGEAWTKFQIICDEAERSGSYFSGSAAGRAVERLAPLLDAGCLVDLGEKLLPQLPKPPSSQNCVFWSLHGRTLYGWTQRPEGFYPGTHRVTIMEDSDPAQRILGALIYGNRFSRTPMSIYPVADALWTLYKDPSRRESPEGTRIKNRIAADLIRWGYGNPQALFLAVALGGPDVDRFLLRSYEQAPNRPKFITTFPDNAFCFILLAQLHDAAGRKFRREHLGAYMALARSYGATWDDFLFCNLDEGPDSLAAHYWPQLLAHTPSDPDGVLSNRWKYLAKMEPLATVSMYVEVWRASEFTISGLSQALSELNTLPDEKRLAVLRAVLNESKKGVNNISEGYLRSEISVLLNTAITGMPTYHEYRWDSLPQWLEHTRPDHPLVEKLAASHDPELRVLVMGALQNYTTPARRVILNRLLHDPDVKVRAAAQKAQRNMEALAGLPASALAQGQ